MTLEEFLLDVTRATNIVIIESHLKKENDEYTQSQFPHIPSYIHFFGESLFATKLDGFGIKMDDDLKEIGDYEICSIEIVNNKDNIPFIAVYIMDSSLLDL